MRQLHIVQSISKNFGGLGTAAFDYSKALSNSGINIKLFVLDGPRQELEMGDLEQNFEVLGSSFLNPFTLFMELRGCIFSGGFDVIHLHGTWSPHLFFACMWGLSKGSKVIVSPHGCLEPWALAHKKLKKRLALFLYQKWIFKSASLIFATAMQEMNSIRSLGIETPVAVLPIGVDLPELQLRNSDGVNRLLFLSRIHPIKGIGNLVAAWEKIRRPNWRLIIAGPDEDGHLLKIVEQVKALGLEEDFEFPGMLTGKAKEDMFAKSKIFVLPTYSENFGIVVAEALAHELPVITTTGTPWEILLEFGCGWWVAPTVDEIARAITLAIDLSDAELGEMGKKGRRLVGERFSWDSIGISAVAAYEWVLERTNQRPNFIYLTIKN